MAVWGIAAMAVVWTAPTIATMDPSALRINYRIGPAPRTETVERTTPVLSALSMPSRGRRRGRHTEAAVGPVALVIESGHSRRMLETSPNWHAPPRGSQAPTWSNAKELAVAVAADWSLSEGKMRLGGGIERVRIADAALSRGKAGAEIMVAAVDYLTDAGWSIGGGWRSTASARGSLSDRLVSLSHGAPLAGAGGFVHAALQVDPSTLFQVEGAIAHLGALDSQILSGGTDHRTMLTLRRQFP